MPMKPPLTRSILVIFAAFFAFTAAADEVVINEIHYEPAEPAELSEFVELYNVGNRTVDLAGWSLANAVDFTFPAGTQLAADSYLLVARDPDGFRSAFGGEALGPWAGKLDNDGETLELLNALGQRVDRVDYRLGFPWPTLSAGRGGSMELVHPGLDNDLGSSWRYSKSPNPLPELVLLPEGSEGWSYRPGDSEASDPVDAWRQPAFVEGGDWLQGGTPVGFGDGDDATEIGDMQGNYSSIFFRHAFEIAPNEIPGSLQLGHYVDDGVVVWINGVEVFRFEVGPGAISVATTAAGSHEAEWETVDLGGIAGLLVEGRNVLAAQVFNSSVGGSDLSFDLSLTRPAAADPDPEATPGRRNSVYSEAAPPNIRQVNHAPMMPKGGEAVTLTAKVTDPDGVASVVLHYQVVEPGTYIRLSDDAYESGWANVAMNDAGEDGDAVAGDAIFTATLPAAVQVHRRLVRYRITLADGVGNSVRVPFNDDTQPNFAYFVYDGVPDWRGALRPGSGDVLTYSAQALTGLQVYQLITDNSDIVRCHYTEGLGTAGTYKYYGTLVVDGIVYDHIRYRIKGRASTRTTGKNKTKINFNLGHRFQAKDNYGRPYAVQWDKFALHTGTCPWWAFDASTGGMVLNEAAAFKFYEMIGTPACNTHFFHLRVIDDAAEADPDDQYDGDFWGLYLAIEEPDGRFLQERGLPDGNVYKMNGSPTKTNQGPTAVLNTSDVSEFTRAIARNQDVDWYRSNMDLEEYYSYKIGTTLVNNTDLRAEWNTVYYLNPDTGRWSMLPWDLDLTWESKLHWRAESVWENWQRMFRHDELERELQNRARDVYDLFVGSGEGAKVFEEFNRILMRGGTETDNIIQANQAVWDYHPRTTKKGIWYRNNPQLGADERDWPHLLQYYKDFVSPFPDGERAGYGGRQLLNEKADDTTEAIPDRPVITYVGGDGYPADDLAFASSEFASSQKPTGFAAMQWRLAEITDPDAETFDPLQPWVYESTPVWESGVLPAFSSRITIPAAAVRPGRTYRARVKHLGASGQWSHWSEPAGFIAATPDISGYLGRLLVTEVMYQPADPTAAELAADAALTASRFEFVEIMNTGAVPLDLTNVRFTKGVEFDFSTSDVSAIEPGQRLVVVGDLGAFRLRYGGLEPAPVVAGVFSKNLSNAGERIKLSYGAGIPLVDFTYGDGGPWPAGADSGGRSLVLARPDLAPDSSLPSAWRESAADGGSPGTDDAIAFTGDPGADEDGDRLSALAEYAFGTSDTAFTSPASVISAGLDFFTDDVTLLRRARLEITFPWRAGADDAAFTIETSTDLVNWTDAGSTMSLRQNDSDGAGRMRLTFRQDAAAAAPVIYARVRIRTLP